MPALKAEAATHAKLRRDAETRLEEGSAPPTVGWSVGVNALSLLHQLASQPASAIDALKLLHELQVYQVELDLQHEQIETSHRDLVDGMERYRAMFEWAPAAYLNLTPQLDILECNLAAARLFDVGKDELRGRSIDGFLAPAGRTELLHLLKRLHSGGARESCELQVKAAQGLRKIQILASAIPGGESFLVVFVELSERR